MKLSKSFARELLIFEQQSIVAISHFSYKKRLKPLFEAGVLVKIPIGKRSYRVQCNDYTYLLTYLQNHYGINNLRAYSEIDENTTRYEAIQIASNSKITNKKVFQGIWLNAFQDIFAKLNDETINLKPTKGGVLFFTEFENLEIDKDIVIVGVENAENFTDIAFQQYLFDTNKRYLFTFRDMKHYKILKQWLLNIENLYLHFGDFDLAGVDIFENQFRNFLGDRATFFVPHNLEELLENSNNTIQYNAQYAKYQHLTGTTTETKKVIQVIHKHQKVLEQEHLINKTLT